MLSLPHETVRRRLHALEGSGLLVRVQGGWSAGSGPEQISALEEIQNDVYVSCGRMITKLRAMKLIN